MPRIELTRSLGVHTKHKMFEGTEHEIVRRGRGGRRAPKWYVKSPATGEEIEVYEHQARELEPIKEQ
jgi:hypothetical protein